MHHSVMYSPPGITAELFKTNLYFWLRLAKSYIIPRFDFFFFHKNVQALSFLLNHILFKSLMLPMYLTLQLK